MHEDFRVFFLVTSISIAWRECFFFEFFGGLGWLGLRNWNGSQCLRMVQLPVTCGSSIWPSERNIYIYIYIYHTKRGQRKIPIFSKELILVGDILVSWSVSQLILEYFGCQVCTKSFSLLQWAWYCWNSGTWSPDYLGVTWQQERDTLRKSDGNDRNL